MQTCRDFANIYKSFYADKSNTSAVQFSNALSEYYTAVLIFVMKSHIFFTTRTASQYLSSQFTETPFVLTPLDRTTAEDFSDFRRVFQAHGR